MAEEFDLIIVGSGSGNSIPGYLSDWNIALVERGVFGGTCLNVGCIPSKMFVLPADRAVEAASENAKLGLETSFGGADWLAIRDRVFGRIDAISSGGEEYRANGTDGLTLIRGTAWFTGDRTFTVSMNDDSPNRVITAPKVLLANGARPLIPALEGLPTVRHHTSDTIMRLDSLPKRLGIFGGGYIAVEMGHVFSALGSDVTLINRSGALLRAQDHDISRRFTEVFSERVDMRLNTLPSKVEQRGEEIVVHTPTGEVVVDELLIAVGRIPNSDLLNPDEGGIQLDGHGRVIADDTMKTPSDGVWAVGDITNAHQLKHLANAEAKVAFWNIAHDGAMPKKVSYKAVPAAVFSHPQVASVGMTEAEALDSGRPFVTGQRDYAGTAYGWALEDHSSFAKVIVATDTEEILGAHIIGPQSASLLQPIIQAMELGQTARQIAEDVFYIHPALTEVIENALLGALEQLTP